MSNLNETIKAVCKDHQVDFVFVSADNQIFLPRAEQHCKNHCSKNQLKYKKVSAAGEVVLEKKDSSKSPESKAEPLTEMSLKKSNKKALQAMLEGKAEFTEENTKAELIEMILKLEEASTEVESKKESEEGEPENKEEGTETDSKGNEPNDQ